MSTDELEKAESKDESSSGTGLLSNQQREQLAQDIREATEFVPIPDVLIDKEGNQQPYWRVRLDIDADPPESFGLDLYGPITLGRALEPGEGNVDFLDLAEHGAANRGVSRHHVELRPAPHGLFAVDLDSTNGTYKNGVQLQQRSPTPLGNRDTLSLGLLHVTVTIIDAPHQEKDWLARQATLGQALTEMAKTIATQLKVADVLNTVVDYAVGLTKAQEATLWLLQPEMRELRLEAARGVEQELIKEVTLPLTGSIAGEAILTGQSQVRVRDELGKKVIISKDYMVDSVIFVPLSLGGLSLGVLSVSNRTAGHEFTENDQTLLATLADFAAIALQNSRTLAATDEALRESLRAQRDATLRALESTRIKTEFLASMSHELRSPLHTINGFSQMMMREAFGELTPQMRDAVGRIQKSGKQLLDMVDEMLDSMRIESQELELAHEEFSPRVLVSEVVGAHMPTAKENSLILSWSSSPDVPDTLMGDPGRVRQILTNLVVNALKFTDQGGISVQIRMVGALMWSVSVADTGKGIAPENQEMIFERFVQEDQSSTREHGGVGLGLAISSDLVKMMGGALRVTSEGVEGKGSVFTMTLPLVLPGQQLVILGENEEDTLRLGKAGPSTPRAVSKPVDLSDDEDATGPVEELPQSQ
jgi:signal transduction histidine kinase